MITVKRTNSQDADFQRLVRDLDKELAIRDGDEHSFYAQFNKIDAIKYVVVAYDDGSPAGCGAIKEYAPAVMEVKRMFVPVEKRGNGIASTALRELELWASELNAGKCILETGKKQTEAIRLYEKSGYCLISNYGQYAGVENSVCFEKELKPSAKITIRAAQPGDAELLADLGRETFHDAFADHPLMPAKDLKLYLDETFTIGQVAAELADPDSIFLLAQIDGEPAAYAKLERNKRENGVTATAPIKLKRLYSKQKFLGSGVGARLMQRCIEEARVRGHDVIWLTVWENNGRAQRFYQKLGFESCGSIDFPLGGSVMTDVLMQLPLEPVN
jgi:putative acetyltransferase